MRPCSTSIIKCSQNASHCGVSGTRPLLSTERDSSSSIRRRRLALPDFPLISPSLLGGFDILFQLRHSRLDIQIQRFTRETKDAQGGAYAAGRWRGGLYHQFQQNRSCSGGVLLDAGICRSEEHTSELQSLRHLVCRL